MKKSKKFVLAGLALLAAITMVLLPLAGCKNDTVPETPKYTVTFNTDGGSTVASQTVESGQKAKVPPSLSWREAGSLVGTVTRAWPRSSTLTPKSRPPPPCTPSGRTSCTPSPQRSPTTPALMHLKASGPTWSSATGPRTS